MRAAIYLRYSSEMQSDGWSIEAQERACTEFIAVRGWTLAGRYCDEARSARYDDMRKRPAFAQMIEDANRHEFDTIIVHKIDRFARNKRVAFDTLHQLGQKGIGFVSVSQNMDYSSPSGKLMLTMLVGLAEFYSDNLSEETKKGKAERKRHGKYNGRLPYGYVKGDDGNAVPDDQGEHSPVSGVRLAFDLAGQGLVDRAIAVQLNALGYRTYGNGVKPPGPFSKDSVRPLLQNRFYLGELPDGDEWIPGNHPAIITEAVFGAAARMRAINVNRGKGRRVQTGQTAPRSVWTLSGIAYCARCGSPMTRNGSKGYASTLRCRRRAQTGECDNGSLREFDVIEMIGERLQDFRLPQQDIERALTRYRHTQSRDVPAVTQRALLHRKLIRLKDLYLEGDISKSDYLVQRNEVNAAISALPIDSDPDGPRGVESLEMLRRVAQVWVQATAEERHQLALSLFERVTLDSKTGVVLTPHPELLAAFRAVLPGSPSSSGSDGIRERDRTFSVTLHIAPVPAISPQHQRKLSEEQQEFVRQAEGYSLRELAAITGVSHETIRKTRSNPGS